MVITIGREFGSGGRELGRRLADELGIAYYDKEILLEIEKKTQYSKEYIEEVCENKPIPLFPIHYGNSWAPISDPHLDQSLDVFIAQGEVIKELANKSSCVIIGRCADYILSKEKPFRIFVYADIDNKVNRCKEREKDGEDLSTKQIIKKINKIDKNRRKYYEYYTNQKWGDKNNYDLLINTSNTNIKEVAHALANMIKKECL